ncbi:MAG: DNA recombination protein RmuC [Proteobacteria bacterium]|nr:DNA recombination protein RmuC [Desulfobacula sp.]MBU3951688.1 DNA recombination protein RmuC [Pseudomonadota bacterium]MBU4132382.1 DNA recombination protein RmuC [Pseudomonadota bacterium]
MEALQNNIVSLETLSLLGIGLLLGFCLGILVSILLARSGALFSSGRLKELSSQALYENSTQFMELAQSYFSGYVREARKDFDIKGDEIIRTVDPVRQILDKYETHLGIMEKDRENAFGAITERLREMAQTQAHLQKETSNLVKALREPHVRGRWGEITLKKVAELSGMVEHCDFEEQLSQGTGKGSLRPDMVVTLPGNRQILVDAKVPLIAYLDALEAADDKERKIRMQDHARQVLAHIANLSSKDYTAHFSPTPEFVVLFIPGESFFSAALAIKPDLIERGIEKGVILATPTTLIALLKTVSYSWQQQKGYENAEQIRSLGALLHSRLCSMTDHMNQLGRDIKKTAATFNRTVGTMERRVMTSARKLETLSVSSRKIPDLGSLDPGVGTTQHFNTRHDDAV